MAVAKFKFKLGDNIGSAAAEDDIDFLEQCYVDTGMLGLLDNPADPRVIILGRTGTGKSALLSKVAADKGEKAIRVSPESLALTYVSNSTILNFLAELDVNLDPFFKLLWRHVLTVEILSHHFEHLPEKKKKSIWEWLAQTLSGQSRADREMMSALEYLNKWGEKFWVQTEYRVKEITEKMVSKINDELKSTIGSRNLSLSLASGSGDEFSTQEKREIRSRAQQIISETQVKDLHHVMDLLDRVLEDRKKVYYLLIDGLDENWVEERLRYRFIMALIATAREFIKVKHAKVVVALRRDLIDRVFRLVRPAGFQEEKYLSLYLPLSWSPDQLIEVLDRRVDALVKSRYTKESVTHGDLLPASFQKTDITTYITKMVATPRDVIAFFNECIGVSTDERRIRAEKMKLAVGAYSRGRLRALADEWSGDYPLLLDFAGVLQKRGPSFPLSDIGTAEIEDLCLTQCSEKIGSNCLLYQKASSVVNCMMKPEDFGLFLGQVFYRTGLVGLKLSSYVKVDWIDGGGRTVSVAEMSPDTKLVIHPKYYRALGIRVD